MKSRRLPVQQQSQLTLKLPLTIEEAYLGASVPVPTPAGEVQMKVPAQAQTGQSSDCAAKV